MRVGDTAMFCVELARPEDPVHWLRNQEEVVAGGRVAITTDGRCHTLTISKCTLEDVGEVTFTAGDCRTSTQFFVSGKGPGEPPFLCPPRSVPWGLPQGGFGGLGQRIPPLVCCPPSRWSPQVTAR